MNSEQYIQELVSRSKKAQQILSTYTQEQVDAIAKMFAKEIYDHAEELAELAIQETRMGVYADKVAKCKGKSRIIWNSLKGKKSVDIIREIPEEGLVELANPKGVVAAITPCTNPVVTPMANGMFCVKCRDTMIVAPHPRGKRCAARVAELYHARLREMGVPEDIFIVIEEPSIELTNLLMKACDVVIATGGMGMVRAAYSSGKPSFGVGAGNVQCLLDRGIDFEEAVEKAITGRTFDNGVICSGEQCFIVPCESYDEIVEIAKAHGAFYIEDSQELEKIRNTVFPNGVISRTVVGQSADSVLHQCGIDALEGVRVILVKPGAAGTADLLNKEKMCPMMCIFGYAQWEDALEIARQNLLYEGAGHTASVHSNDRSHIDQAGIALPVSRVVVNQISSTMAGGAFANGLNPTTTLGCGSWGNNSISENLTYFHLMNVSRIAMVKPDWKQPSDEEIFA